MFKSLCIKDANLMFKLSMNVEKNGMQLIFSLVLKEKHSFLAITDISEKYISNMPTMSTWRKWIKYPMTKIIWKIYLLEYLIQIHQFKLKHWASRTDPNWFKKTVSFIYVFLFQNKDIRQNVITLAHFDSRLDYQEWRSLVTLFFFLRYWKKVTRNVAILWGNCFNRIKLKDPLPLI